MKEELTGIRTNLLGIHVVVFGQEFPDGEKADVIELALTIRRKLKGDRTASSYIRKRFNLVLQHMGCVDFKLSEEFYKQCV